MDGASMDDGPVCSKGIAFPQELLSLAPFPEKLLQTSTGWPWMVAVTADYGALRFCSEGTISRRTNPQMAEYWCVVQ